MFHLHVRRVSRGANKSAIDRLAYISRTGRYEKRGDKVRLITSLNMPNWVVSDSALEYWEEADSGSMRVNGRLMFSVECALPRKLSAQDQDRIAFDFTRLVSRMSTGRRHKVGLPCTYAIHEGIHSDDESTGRQANPHFHLLLSPSINDGLARTRGSWFKRSNSKNPELGGATRSKFIGTKKWLLRLRKAWARLANAALRRAGLPASLDHRSHFNRGLLIKPSVHVGAKGSHLIRQGHMTRKSKRNSRIQQFNARIEALHAQHVYQNKLSARRKRDLHGQEYGLRQSLKMAMSQLESEIFHHPFTVGASNMQATAMAVVTPLAPTRPVNETKEGDFENLCSKVRHALGTSWISVRVAESFWFFCPPSDSVLVVGKGYVATDAVEEEFLEGFALAVRTVGLGMLQGSVKPEVQSVVADIFSRENIACDWNALEKKIKLTR